MMSSTIAIAGSDLDPLWNPPDGYTVTHVGIGDAVVNAVAMDSVGRMVVAGYSTPSSGSNGQFSLVRYHGDDFPASIGYEDLTFNSNGIASVPVGIASANGYAVQSGCTDASATGIKLDAGGRVFVSGTCMTTQNVLALVHYNANGTLDTAFAPNGYETEVFGNYASASALVLDGNGRPIVVGQRIANGVSEVVINRHDYIFSHGFE